MRLVVTGSRGKVGTAVVEWAQAQGADVLGVDVMAVSDRRGYTRAPI